MDPDRAGDVETVKGFGDLDALAPRPPLAHRFGAAKRNEGPLPGAPQ